MKTRQHKILDHPIISYFLLLVFALVISELVGNIDGVINHHVLGIESGSDVHLGCGIGAAIGAVVAMGLFKLWFKPDFKGCLQRKGLFQHFPGQDICHSLYWKCCQLDLLRNGKRLTGAFGGVFSGLC